VRLLIAGATGLVGQHALDRALGDPRVSKVTAVTRRHLDRDDAKLDQHLADFGTLGALPPADAALCALGTTMRRAGSKQAFLAVDHDAVLAFARASLAAGARRFAIVSSVGARAGSRNFYLDTKGRVEAELAGMGFERLVMLRPGLLDGEREEFRPLEQPAILVARILNPLLIGAWRRYRAISAQDVADALLEAVLAETAPAAILDYDAIRRLAHSMPSSR
jgi:uncharacterized protein YbjT (DUF2867 family)